MVSDYEYLYMIRQRCESAFNQVASKYERLIWKRDHTFFNEQKPDGINVEDLYQEGFLGFYSSLYSFSEERKVGFAFYVSLCVESHIKTALRRCRGKSYRMLDSKFSLDSSISEDDSLSLYEVSSSYDVRESPAFMAVYQEAQVFLKKVLSQLSHVERDIYHLQDQGFSYREISSRIGVSEKKVDNTIQKIRKLLRMMN